MINRIKSCRQIEKYQGWKFLFIDCKKKLIIIIIFIIRHNAAFLLNNFFISLE